VRSSPNLTRINNSTGNRGPRVTVERIEGGNGSTKLAPTVYPTCYIDSHSTTITEEYASRQQSLREGPRIFRRLQYFSTPTAIVFELLFEIPYSICKHCAKSHHRSTPSRRLVGIRPASDRSWPLSTLSALLCSRFAHPTLIFPASLCSSFGCLWSRLLLVHLVSRLRTSFMSQIRKFHIFCTTGTLVLTFAAFVFLVN
jgi:hypothetical protein